MKTYPPAQASHTPQADAVPQLIAATAHTLPEQVNALARARAFAEPLMAGETLDSGENTLAHADAVAAILKGIGGSEAMQAASYLVYACDHLKCAVVLNFLKASGDHTGLVTPMLLMFTCLTCVASSPNVHLSCVLCTPFEELDSAWATICCN